VHIVASESLDASEEEKHGNENQPHHGYDVFGKTPDGPATVCGVDAAPCFRKGT
jgi:hypothetical protein